MSLKIYTKVGDAGNTSLFGGQKVSKGHQRIEAYDTIDELNSFIGWLRDQPEVNEKIRSQLIWVQETLFSIGTILATEKAPKGFQLPTITSRDVEKIEGWIDKYDEELPELKNFILPGGHQVVSLCHVCRTVCRRTERSIVGLGEIGEIGKFVVPFINRLSDYFFTLARTTALLLKVEEVPWNMNR